MVRLVVRLVAGAVLLIIAILVLMMAYLSLWGVPRPIQARIEARLRAAGLQLKQDRIRFIPPLGLILQNVKAEVSDTNLVCGFEARQVMTQLSIRSLKPLVLLPRSLSIDGGTFHLRKPDTATDLDSETIRLEGIHASMLMEGCNCLLLERASFRIGNLDWYVVGILNNLNLIPAPPTYPAPGSPGQPLRLPSGLADKLFQASRLCACADGNIAMTITGDVSAPTQSRAELRLNLKQFQFGNMTISGLTGTAHFNGPTTGDTNFQCSLDTAIARLVHPVRTAENVRLVSTLSLAGLNGAVLAGRIQLAASNLVWDLGTIQNVQAMFEFETRSLAQPETNTTGVLLELPVPIATQIRCEMTLDKPVVCGTMLEQLCLTTTWSGSNLLITNVEARLGGGQLRGWLALDTDSGQARFSIASRCDLHLLSPFLTDAMRMRLAALAWAEPPQLELTGQARLAPLKTDQGEFSLAVMKDHTRLEGSVNANRLWWNGIRIDSFQTKFEYTNRCWILPQARLGWKNAAIECSLWKSDLTGEVFCRAVGTVDPSAIQPGLPLRVNRALDRFRFGSPPEVKTEISWDAQKGQLRAAVGSIRLQDVTYRGVSARTVETEFEYTNRLLVLRNVAVTASDQAARATCITVNLDRQQVEIQNATGSVRPLDVARVIGNEAVNTLSQFVFEATPTGSVTGVVPFHGTQGTDLRFEFSGEAFRWWRLRLTNFTATVHWVDEHVDLLLHDSCFYGGRLHGQAHFDWSPPKGTDLRFTALFTNVNTRSLLYDVTGAVRKTEGSIDGQLSVTKANTDDFRSWIGEAELTLRDGYVWELPLFSVLTPVVNSVVPGLGSTRFTDGTATCIITNGQLVFSRLLLQSPLLRLNLQGTVSFDGTVDMRVRSDILRDVWVIGPVIEGVMTPFARAFEYQLTGNITNPVARPVYLPKQLFYPIKPLRWLFDRFPHGAKHLEAPSRTE